MKSKCSQCKKAFVRDEAYWKLYSEFQKPLAQMVRKIIEKSRHPSRDQA